MYAANARPCSFGFQLHLACGRISFREPAAAEGFLQFPATLHGRQSVVQCLQRFLTMAPSLPSRERGARAMPSVTRPPFQLYPLSTITCPRGDLRELSRPALPRSRLTLSSVWALLLPIAAMVAVDGPGKEPISLKPARQIATDLPRVNIARRPSPPPHLQ